MNVNTNVKQTSRCLLPVLAVGAVVLCVLSPEVFAVELPAIGDEGGSLVGGLRTLVNGKIKGDAVAVATGAAFLVTLVAALGQKIGQFILSNISYILYAAFGGTALTAIITAGGVTI